jgi:hypothetical protein
METYSKITQTLMPEFPFAAWPIAQVEAFARRLLRNASVTEEQLLLETRKYCQYTSDVLGVKAKRAIPFDTARFG